MHAIRHALGLDQSAPPPMTDEQSKLAAEQGRLEARIKKQKAALEHGQRSVDLQLQVLRADAAERRKRAR